MFYLFICFVFGNDVYLNLYLSIIPIKINYIIQILSLLLETSLDYENYCNQYMYSKRFFIFANIP